VAIRLQLLDDIGGVAYLSPMIRDCSLVATLVLSLGSVWACRSESKQVAATVTSGEVSNSVGFGKTNTAALPTNQSSDGTDSSSVGRFANAVEQVVSGSGPTNCALRAIAGWAEVRCRATNAGGGQLRRAHVKRGLPPGAALDIEPMADGTITLVFPWVKGERAEVRFEWEDMTQDMSLAVRGSKFTRILPAEQADQCERFAKTSEQILDGIRAKIGPLSPGVTPKDVYRFPSLGRCVMAEKIAWAMSLEQLKASGEGANREVVVTLGVNRIDPTGSVATCSHGPLAFAPEGLQIPDMMLFDYDNDGEAEVVIRQDILIQADRSRTKMRPQMPAVYSYQRGSVLPYPRLRPFESGGIVAEQLDTDGRPDVGDYGPFLAWLPDHCGRGECPRRIVGPRFFLHSNSDGSFSAADEETDGVIRKKCEHTPMEVVVDVRTASGKRQTAQNVACARVRGDTTEEIVAQLNEYKSEMCEDTQTTCALFTTLVGWAQATPPRMLTLPQPKGG
jgi:hypothetical protein